MKILNSATKSVLMALTVVLAVITLYSVILGVWRGVLDPKDILALFGSAISFVFGFYFGKRDVDNQPSQSSEMG